MIVPRVDRDGRTGEVVSVNDRIIQAVPKGGILRFKDEICHTEWKVWRRDFKRRKLHLHFLRDLPIEDELT